MPKQELILSDMSFCQPKEAIVTKPKSGSWVAYPYEADELSGIMITAAVSDNPIEITLPLKAKGLYDIYVGVHYGFGWQHAGAMLDCYPEYCLQIRFDDEPYYDAIIPEYYPEKSGRHPNKNISFDTLSEVLWRRARLDGRSLVFSSPSSESFRFAYSSIAYIRLVPTQDDAFRPNKRLIAMYDGAFIGNYPRSEAELRGWIEPLRESDVGILSWTTSRFDACDYPTNIGSMRIGCDAEEFHPAYYPHYMGRDLTDLLSRGIDPLRTVIKYGHDMGLLVLGSMRFSGLRVPPQHFPLSDPSYFADHSEFWVVTEEGLRAPHMSLAFEPVRQKVIDIFREQIEKYELDGVHFILTRGHPFVGCEDPSAKDFKCNYNECISEMDPMDERVWRHKATYITELIKGLRKMLDSVQEKKGRSLSLAVNVFNSINHCRYFGLDVDEWLGQNLVQHLIVYPTQSPDAFETAHVTTDNIVNFKKLARKHGDRCKVYAELYPRLLPPEKSLQKANDYYHAGADGLSYWDTYQRQNRKSEWNILKILGHKDSLPSWETRAKSLYRFVPLKSIAGLIMNPRYWPATHG